MSNPDKREKQLHDDLCCDNHALHVQNFLGIIGSSYDLGITHTL